MTNQHNITILFGKDEVRKYLDGETLSTSEKEIYLKTYHFKSEAEKLAFQQGVEEAVGWQECLVL